MTNKDNYISLNDRESTRLLINGIVIVKKGPSTISVTYLKGWKTFQLNYYGLKEIILNNDYLRLRGSLK